LQQRSFATHFDGGDGRSGLDAAEWIRKGKPSEMLGGI